MFRFFLLFFCFILLVFQHKAFAEWQEVVSFNGVERYGIDFSDEPPSHIYGNDVYWLFGNKNENGANAQRNLFKVNLLTGLSEEVTLSTPYSLIGNSTVLYKNKIFSVGGQKNNQRNHAMNTLVSYDVVSREIEYLPSSPLSRSGSCTLPYNGNLYVFGGKGFDTFNKSILKIDDDGFYYTDLVETATLRPEIQKYDIAQKKWSILQHKKLLPGSLSCSQINQHFYFVGRNTYHDSVGELFHFDLINSAWVTLQLPTPLSYVRLTTVGDKVVVVGKQDFSVGQIWEMYVYDTKAGSWSEKITTPSNSAFVSIRGFEEGIYLFEISSSSDEEATSYKIYHYDSYSNQQ
ncbi:Kelch repeat-containing protein [Pseudoalteromonas gelatinilytica]